MSQSSSTPRRAFTILTDTLVDGPIVAWVASEEGEQDVVRPVVFESRAAALAELASDRASLDEEVANGEREPDEVPDDDEDYVVECLVHADGSLEIPSLGVHWTLNDIRAQRGMLPSPQASAPSTPAPPRRPRR